MSEPRAVRLSPAAFRALGGWARATLVEALGGPAAVAPTSPELTRPGATFVTLYDGERLLGCIGDWEGARPLLEAVAEHTRQAAFDDPRGRPLSREDGDRLTIEVSLLGEAEPVPARDEAEAIAALRPGVDGVILGAYGRRALFLPQVWEALPEPAVFLSRLRRKAGLPADLPMSELTLSRFTVEKHVDAPRRQRQAEGA